MRSPFNRLGLSRLSKVDHIGLILAAPETAPIRQPDPIFESLEQILRQRASQPRRSTNKDSSAAGYPEHNRPSDAQQAHDGGDHIRCPLPGIACEVYGFPGYRALRDPILTAPQIL